MKELGALIGPVANAGGVQDQDSVWGFNSHGKDCLYQWRFLPFGLKNAPAEFQRVMDRILAGLDFVRCYIDDILFTLVTDHQLLKWLMESDKLTGKLARWTLILHEYYFQVVHRPGVANLDADGLSQNPCTSQEDDTGGRWHVEVDEEMVPSWHASAFMCWLRGDFTREYHLTSYSTKRVVLSHFGAPIESLTDQGTEFKGEFQVLCDKALIDHRTTLRDHPEADDLAERVVQTVKKALRKVLSHFGASAESLTDQGTKFKGEFQVLCDKALIDHRTTLRDHPEADDLAERVVQTVKKALRKYGLQKGHLEDLNMQLP
ncbi:hypothetical protein AXG93_3256s1330 [Marchantia polymorpha subsp. ruderalis]|uniref:Integrase catalytic domain-containing protein n=1 Tax=Marchantia polymorpha subsp. ruderalis TaxID=1480154 RepID=A0A176VM93_MARPO|nr:hypothetical protein AXG93_3256s1330 [Marchantia polymorpha subsp. ruderalis]